MSTQPVPPAVEQYLASLHGSRAEAVRAVFDTVHAAMPEGYELAGDPGAPLWSIPLSTYPVTYNTEPLAYVGLADQKQYVSLYLMRYSLDEEAGARFRAAWADAGLKLNMGKVCLRFTRLAQVDLDLVADSVAGMPVERYIAAYESSRRA